MKVSVHTVLVAEAFLCDLTPETEEFLLSRGLKETTRSYIYSWSGPKSLEGEWRKECDRIEALEDPEQKKLETKTLCDRFPYLDAKDIQVNDEELTFLTTKRIPYEYKSETSITINPTNQDLSEKFADLTNKFLEGLNRANELAFNTKVHAPKTDGSLLSINQVMLEQDCCTDHLQNCIDKGWRILTVCPQPDQRRPDYILGKYEAP